MVCSSHEQIWTLVTTARCWSSMPVGSQAIDRAGVMSHASHFTICTTLYVGSSWSPVYIGSVHWPRRTVASRAAEAALIEISSIEREAPCCHAENAPLCRGHWLGSYDLPRIFRRGGMVGMVGMIDLPKYGSLRLCVSFTQSRSYRLKATKIVTTVTMPVQVQ